MNKEEILQQMDELRKKLADIDGYEETTSNIGGEEAETTKKPNVTVTLDNCNKNEFVLQGTVLLKYKGSKADVEIPFGVTKICDYAFQNNEGLNSVIIPDGVTEIGSMAFDGCKKLVCVIIPDSVNTIGERAFQNCGQLKSAVIPEGVTAIKDATFLNCCNLTKIVVPQSLTSIGYRAFSSCHNLEMIFIPEGVTSLGENTFYDCSKLTVYCAVSQAPRGWHNRWYFTSNYEKVKIVWGYEYGSTGKEVAADNNPDNFEIQGTTLIKYNGNASSVKIPDGVTSIVNAFSANTKITSVEMPQSVKTIGEKAFSGCSGLKSVTIPENVKIIGESSFAGCKNLKAVNLNKKVKEIGDSAFLSCEKLEKIVIPSSVRAMGKNVFAGCKKTIIYCEAKKKPFGWNKWWRSGPTDTVFWNFKK